MVTKKDMAKYWVKTVLENLDNLEKDIERKILNGTITEEVIDKQINDLRQHYGAINNLKKSFNNNTFFTGYIDLNKSFCEIKVNKWFDSFNFFRYWIKPPFFPPFRNRDYIFKNQTCELSF